MCQAASIAIDEQVKGKDETAVREDTAAPYLSVATGPRLYLHECVSARLVREDEFLKIYEQPSGVK